MKLLLISNGIYEYDGRLRELIKIVRRLGETTYITRIDSEKSIQDDQHICIKSNTKLNYFGFIIISIITAFKMRKIDVMFVDNRKAIVPSLIIRILLKPTVIVQDVRELYFHNEVKSIHSKIGCFFEKLMINRADILIGANSYRTRIMKEYYQLTDEPLVYENIRKLKFSNMICINNFQEKYKGLIKGDTFKIISTAGFDVKRTTDKLVLAMKDLGDKYELLLVGGGSEEDRAIISKIVDDYKLNNIHFIKRVGEDEMKYLIQKCDLGVVNYGKYDINNKYCASGKIYEFIFEGLPVITTENIPLVDMVEKHKIGIADDEYINGIRKIASDYAFYKANVIRFIDQIDVNENNYHLYEILNKSLKQIL